MLIIEELKTISRVLSSAVESLERERKSWFQKREEEKEKKKKEKVRDARSDLRLVRENLSFAKQNREAPLSDLEASLLLALEVLIKDNLGLHDGMYLVDESINQLAHRINSLSDRLDPMLGRIINLEDKLEDR